VNIASKIKRLLSRRDVRVIGRMPNHFVVNARSGLKARVDEPSFARRRLVHRAKNEHVSAEAGVDSRDRIEDCTELSCGFAGV